MIMDVGFVDVGADNKSMIALGEAPRQLTAQAVGLLRGDLARNKGLPDGIGNHIIGPAPPAGLSKILPLGKQKLRVRDPAVALVAGDQPAAVRFFWILHIVDDVLNGLAHSPSLAYVQRHDAGGCHWRSLPSKETARDWRTVSDCVFSFRRTVRQSSCP